VSQVSIICDVYNGRFFEFALDEESMPTFSTNAPFGGANNQNPDTTGYASGDASARAWAEKAFCSKIINIKWNATAGPYQFQ